MKRPVHRWILESIALAHKPGRYNPSAFQYQLSFRANNFGAQHQQPLWCSQGQWHVIYITKRLHKTRVRYSTGCRAVVYTRSRRISINPIYTARHIGLVYPAYILTATTHATPETCPNQIHQSHQRAARPPQHKRYP